MSASHKAPPPPSCAIVIFGANGDLTKRLIVPALYNLARTGMLPQRLALIGVDHNDKTSRGMARRAQGFSGPAAGQKQRNASTKSCGSRSPQAMIFLKGDFEKDGHLSANLATAWPSSTRRTIWAAMSCSTWRWPTASSPPSPASWARRAWSTQKEGQLPPPDRGKAFRPRSGIGQGARMPACSNISRKSRSTASIISWGRKRCRTSWRCASPTACSSRSGTATASTMSRSRWPKASASKAAAISMKRPGALRDMVPNHLFQLVAMTAMEPPVSFDAEDIRAKKAEMFKAMHPLTLGDVVRGQYDAGVVGGRAGAGLSRRSRMSRPIPTSKPLSPCAF